MALKKSQLYSSLWASCDELRGGMDASQYKDYVLTLLFIKYVSDKYAGQPYAPITVPKGASFADMVALKGKPDIGDSINKKIIQPLADANKLSDLPDFNAEKLGSGKEKVGTLTNLIAIFENPALDFSRQRAGDDDLLGDAYEYLMRHFATESGKSKGQFYTPAEVSRVIAQVIGISEAKTTNATTVYDPTCGSGSLLLKVADEATTRVTLYGQEKDSSTAGLARMNMILHDNAEAQIVQGNTLTGPRFLDRDKLRSFDYVVANPPFSDKRWSTGLDPAADPFGRFEGFGIPPNKQGDYAYLLHILRSLKSTGRGACILPHGVLFRGNAEAEIRRNLVHRGVIRGIIGLPANLFYGTGIPACIVVLDKKDAAARKGIFMIDASAGYVKDGPKNRLRSRDIHKIVDTFHKQNDVPKYARMVPRTEIEANDYNLNLPRYVDSQTPEDRQDIEAHLKGGIPEADMDALDAWWAVCPALRTTLFKPDRTGYVALAVNEADIKSAIREHPQFAAFVERMRAHFETWRSRQSDTLKALEPGFLPKDLIGDLSESLLAHYRGQPLLDAYAVYQHLMDYWTETMQDDAYLIAAFGWQAEPYRIIEKDKKGKEKDKGWTCDLVPKPLIVARYFAAEQTALNELNTELETNEAQLNELEDEHGGEDGVLKTVDSKKDAQQAWSEAFDAAWADMDKEGFKIYASKNSQIEKQSLRHVTIQEDSRLQRLKNNKGNINQKPVKERIQETDNEVERKLLEEYLALKRQIASLKKETKGLLEEAAVMIQAKPPSKGAEGPLVDLAILNEWFELDKQKSTLKKRIKQAEAALDAEAVAKYAQLTEADIKALVVDDKWLPALQTAIGGEVEGIGQRLTTRVKELAGRYAHPLPELEREVEIYSAKVEAHLKQMGMAW